jgi:hypothetical protein
MPGRDRPQPRFDQDTSENEIMALGLISGALAQSRVVQHEGVTELSDAPVIMSIVLAATDQDHPRLFLRFPNVLKSEYEVTLHLVPDTEVEE